MGWGGARLLIIGVVGTLTLFRNLVPPLPIPHNFFEDLAPLPLDLLCVLNHILIANFVKI